MVSGKPPRIRNQIIELVRKRARDGIFQKDLQELLGISKSYCSEQLAYLSEVSHIIAKRKEGGLVKVYHLEFYPGMLKGVARIGMLRSSEYIPSIATFNEVLGKAGFKVFFRFYDGTRELIRDFNMETLEFMLAPTQALIMSGLVEDNLMIFSGLASGGSGIISHQSGRPAVLSTELSSMISLASENMLQKLPGEIESYDNPNAAMNDYLAGKCSMIAIWEPYFSQIVELPGNSVLIRYTEVMGEFPCCSAAVNRNCYDALKKSVEIWISDYAKLRVPEDRRLPSFREAVQKVSEATGVGPAVVEASMAGYDFAQNRISLGKLREFGINLSARQRERLFLPDVLSD